MTNKIFIGIVGGLLFLYFLQWSFNHLSPYISFGSVLLAIYLVLKYITKTKKDEKK